jgi:hypothetical protein
MRNAVVTIQSKRALLNNFVSRLVVIYNPREIKKYMIGRRINIISLVLLIIFFFPFLSANGKVTFAIPQ